MTKSKALALQYAGALGARLAVEGQIDFDWDVGDTARIIVYKDKRGGAVDHVVEISVTIPEEGDHVEFEKR